MEEAFLLRVIVYDSVLDSSILMELNMEPEQPATVSNVWHSMDMHRRAALTLQDIYTGR